MMSMKRHPYIILDPWPTRVRTTLSRLLICSWRGHDRAQKMYGPGPCRRCD